MCDDFFETDVKDLWGLCTPNSIIVVYSRTATSYFLGAKE